MMSSLTCVWHWFEWCLRTFRQIDFGVQTRWLEATARKKEKCCDWKSTRQILRSCLRQDLSYQVSESAEIVTFLNELSGDDAAKLVLAKRSGATTADRKAEVRGSGLLNSVIFDFV